MLADHPLMPTQQRRGRHKERRPSIARQQPRQQGEDRAIGGYQFGSTHLAAQHADLVTQDRDLNFVLEPRAQPAADDIDQSADQ